MTTIREKEYEVTVLVRQKVKAKGISEEDALWQLNDRIESGQSYEPVPGNTHLTQIEKIRCVDVETVRGRFYISKDVINLYNSYIKQKPYGKRSTIFSHTHVFRDGNMMTVQLNAPSEKKKAELSMKFTDFRCQELAGKKILPKTIDGEYRFVLSDFGKEYVFVIAASNEKVLRVQKKIG